jgi:hypothetical protein
LEVGWVEGRRKERGGEGRGERGEEGGERREERGEERGEGRGGERRGLTWPWMSVCTGPGSIMLMVTPSNFASP